LAALMRAAGIASSWFMTANRVSSAASLWVRASERRLSGVFAIMDVPAFRARAKGEKGEGQ
jgi:hypothetical protein